MKHVHAYLLALMLLLPSMGMADDVLRVNTSIKPPFSTKSETGFFDLIIKDLARRLDRRIELVRLPPERALVSVNQGISDMELPRIAGMEKQYPNLVMVDEKLIDYMFVAFSRNRLAVASWDDLEDKRVGYLLGWKIFENSVPNPHLATKLRKPVQLFRMLNQGRIDVALYERYAGWNIIESDGLKGIEECPRPLAHKPMYIYLHSDKAGLAPDIAKCLRQMKEDGTYKKIMDETLLR